jgi:hypothetical protein
MKRLDSEGSCPQVGIRVPQKTIDALESLIASLPPHPIAGPLARADVLRAVLEAGIDALAIREGIKLGTAPKPTGNGKAARKVRASSKTTGAQTVHPRSRVRAEKRAAARLAAGCTCKSRHVPPCKLYRAA